MTAENRQKIMERIYSSESKPGPKPAKQPLTNQEARIWTGPLPKVEKFRLSRADAWRNPATRGL